jgi:hypothetical protein
MREIGTNVMEITWEQQRCEEPTSLRAQSQEKEGSYENHQQPAQMG